MVNGIKTAPQVIATDVATQKLLSRIQAGYDPAADSVQQLAHNTVQTWGLLQLLMKGAPSKSDAAGLATYNAAVALGTTGMKVDKNTAISKILDAHTDMLAALASRMTSKEDAGADTAALGKMLTDIKNAISTRNETYGVYNAYGVPRAAIQGMLSGETAAAVPQTGAAASQMGIKTTTTEDIAMMPTPAYWRGSIQVTAGKQQTSLVQLKAPDISEQLNNQFRVDHPNDPAGTIYQGSRDVMQAYTNIVQFLQNGGDPKGADAAKYAKAFANALSQIPANAPIRTDKNSPFNLALQALNNGQLVAGLAMLGGSTVFNNPDFFNSINNLFVLATNPREYVVMQPGINLKWNFLSNQASWMKYLTGHPGVKGEGGIVTFDPKALYMGLAMHYATTILSGQWQRMQYTSEGALLPTGERGLLTGRGSAAGETLTWAEALGLIGQPMEFIFNATAFQKQAHMDAAKTTLSDGTTINVPAQDYHLSGLGIVSLDINFRDKEGKRSRFSILPPAAIGGGVIPDYDFVNNELHIKGADWFGYMTFLWTSAAKNDWTVQAMVTPEISSIMKALRLGGQITPAEFTKQTENYMLQLGATAREEYDLKTYVSTLDFAGNARYVGTMFKFPLDILARGGYGFETGGSQLDRVRGGPFLTVDLTIPITKSTPSSLQLSGLKPKRE